MYAHREESIAHSTLGSSSTHSSMQLGSQMKSCFEGDLPQLYNWYVSVRSLFVLWVGCTDLDQYPLTGTSLSSAVSSANSRTVAEAS